MRVTVAVIFAALVVAVVGAPIARADTFVAGGYSFPSPAPFQVITDKDEICAPAASALRRLGVQVSSSDKRIELRAPNGSSVLATFGSDRAMVGQVERVLPVAPSLRGDNAFLPVRAVAWHLGIAYRWDEASRTIFLHPRVTDITFARLPDKVRVRISGTGQLSYSVGMLRQPARLYVDISNADLFAAEQQIAVSEGDLIGVRASQHSLNPDLVRVVLDVKREDVQYIDSAADGGRSIILDLPAPLIPPSGAGGVILVRSVRLERRYDSVCALVVEADGAPVASLSTRRNPPQVIVELSNVRLSAEEVEGTHSAVESATAEQTGESEARVVLNLKEPLPAALVRRPTGVCVLTGKVPLTDVTVVLDAGHGGRQPGAIGPSGLEEKAVNLAVALAAEKALKELGAQVILTRRDDSSLVPVASREDLRRELAMRAEVANTRRADVFVSLHCNACPKGVRRVGTETYYCTARSLGLAKVMQQELVRELKLNDGGTRSANFVVIREAKMPAVLLEMAYLNDRHEEALLGSPAFRERAARAVASGLRRFADEGGLLEYYAELESAKWAQAFVERDRSEPGEVASEISEDKPGVGGAANDLQPEGDDAVTPAGPAGLPLQKAPR
ncbi:MAG: N-acetylmuramoyl-L-alanine amidase [Armatimonadota bacterium]|nr:MAG: N-acetylmuramoyl-L-alanine amidase [Armatimonadota bacterium]